jgi:putrescine transport system substrate-binding protein
MTPTKLCVAMACRRCVAAAAAGQAGALLVPDEGSVLFIDSLVVIPSSAKRPDLAHRFINYLDAAQSCRIDHRRNPYRVVTG